MNAPGLPDIPVIGACPSCDDVFWFEDATKVGEIDPFATDRASPSEWHSASTPITLNEDKLLDAIDAGLGTTPERLLHLRLFAWHAFNDQFRNEYRASNNPSPSPRQKYNMEQLEVMFQSSGGMEGQFIIAEIARQLGKFTKAKNILNHIGIERLLQKKQFIAELCDQESRMVRMLPFDKNETA